MSIMKAYSVQGWDAGVYENNPEFIVKFYIKGENGEDKQTEHISFNEELAKLFINSLTKYIEGKFYGRS